MKFKLPKSKTINASTWNIHWNTNWEEFQDRTSELLLNQRPILQAIPDTTQRYKNWLQVVKGTAITTIGKRKIQNNSSIRLLPPTPEIKAARCRRNTAKYLYNQAIQTRSHHFIQNALNNYKESQTALRKIIEDVTITQTEKTLVRIAESGGMNSKLFWNLIRQLRRPNSEDLLPIMKEDGTFIYKEDEIKV